jgi:hypothetical protein
MPHVTFIHGICNKPPQAALLQAWLRALESNNGLDLGNEGVSSSMVYWADVLYEKPDDEAGYESAADDFEGLRVGPEPIAPEKGLAWQDSLAKDEQLFVDGVARKIGLEAMEAETPPSAAGSRDGHLERVYLPWFVKREVMRHFLRDVHHYLFNEQFSPRPGVSYQVQTEIRRRFVKMLKEAPATRPHVVVSHSMGTVIAYDCLKRVPECPPVDGLLTVGCPLGIDEVQDKLKPEWTRQDGFPEKVGGQWLNVNDKLDPVAGGDWNLANDFRKQGQAVIDDIQQENEGAWRHSATKYLKGAKLRKALERLLGF